MRKLICALAMIQSAATAQWAPLFNGKNLDGWQSVGNGVWRVMEDGTLVGQRDPYTGFFRSWPVTEKQYNDYMYTQAWLYTVKDFGQFDLRLEYWLRYRGNSGISIRDTSRARYAVATPADFGRTPSRIGYEIQLSNHYPDQYPSGSIYTFQKAKTGYEKDNGWNTLYIESRNDRIRVRLNGHAVAEHPGDPKRSKTGPIGLQLHDQYCVVMFRNIRIREIR